MIINRIIPVLFLLALQTQTCSAGPLRIAVLPGDISDSQGAVTWLGTGVSFDIEKRLERWPALVTCDRIDICRAVKLASVKAESSRVTSVFEKLQPDVVVAIFGSEKQGKLDVAANVWTDPDTLAGTIKVSSKLSNLFLLHDALVDRIVEVIRQKFNILTAPEKPERLHLPPAASVEAYARMIQGMRASQSGDDASARPLLTKALELDPRCWWAHYFLGAVEFHGGCFTGAVERCKYAINIDPDLYPAIYANLAYSASGAGDASLAEWAKGEFEKRTGKALPKRGLPVGR